VHLYILSVSPLSSILKRPIPHLREHFHCPAGEAADSYQPVSPCKEPDFTSGVGGDQNRATRRENIGHGFIRSLEMGLLLNADCVNRLFADNFT